MASKRDRVDQRAAAEEVADGDDSSKRSDDRPVVKARSQVAAKELNSSNAATDSQSELWRTCARLKMQPEFRTRSVLRESDEDGKSTYEVVVVLDGVDFASASNANQTTVNYALPLNSFRRKYSS